MSRGEIDLRQAAVAVEEDKLPLNGAVTSEVVTVNRAGEFKFTCHYCHHYRAQHDNSVRRDVIYL